MESEPLMGESQEEDKKRTEYRRLFIGITSVIGLHMVNILSIGCVQLMKKVPPDFELNAFRFLVGLVFCAMYLSGKRMLPKVEKENIKWVFCLVVTSMGFNLFMYSKHLKEIPVVTVLSVYSTFHIIFTLILSRIFLESSIRKLKVLISFVTLTGTALLIVAKVWSCLENNKESRKLPPWNNTSITNDTWDKLGSHIAAKNQTISPTEAFSLPGSPLNAFLMAVVYTIPCSMFHSIKGIVVAATVLKDSDIVPYAFWYHIITFCISTTITLTAEKPFIPETTSDILLCVGHASCAASGTFFGLIILQNLEQNAITVMSCIALPLAYFLQTTVLRNVTMAGHTWLYVVGLVTVVSSSLITPVYEYFLIKHKETEKTENSCDE